jgi:hypothetical protein
VAATEYVPVAPEDQGPRLAIVHLLVLTACIALVLALTRIVWLPGRYASATVFENLVWLAIGFWVGTALSGAMLAVAQWKASRPYPIHPGEWLWLANGATVFVGLLVYAPGAALLERPALMRVAEGLLLCGLIPGFYLHLLVLIVAAARVDETHWRANIVVCALSYPLQCGCCTFFPAATTRMHPDIGWLFLLAPALLRLATVLIASTVDLRRANKRPWSHWTGLSLQVALDATVLVAMAVTLAASLD